MDAEAVTDREAYTLYLCHFLSTCNARIYEFAAVIFIAAAFPKDLAASSI
jgi:iron-regulated transporter 1